MGGEHKVGGMPLVWLISIPALTKQLAERKSLVISPAPSWAPFGRCRQVVAKLPWAVRDRIHKRSSVPALPLLPPAPGAVLPTCSALFTDTKVCVSSEAF